MRIGETADLFFSEAVAMDPSNIIQTSAGIGATPQIAGLYRPQRWGQA